MKKRIDLAFDKYKGMARCEIVPLYCPKNVLNTLPDIDFYSAKRDGEGHIEGCRGITCEQCWDSEVLNE